MTAGTSRWERWARPRVLIAVVVVVLLTTVGLIVAVLGPARPDEQAGRGGAVAVGEPVQRRPRGPDPAAGRHPARPRRRPRRRRAPPRRREAADRGLDRLVRAGRARRSASCRTSGPSSAAFPWDRLVASRGRDDGLRREAMELIARSEERVNVLRSAAGEAVLRRDDGVAEGEPARPVRARDAGDTRARARHRRDHRRAAPQPQRRRAGLRRAQGRGRRAAGGRGGAAGERGPVPLARAARLRPHDRHRRPAASSPTSARPSRRWSATGRTTSWSCRCSCTSSRTERADVATAITLLTERPGLVRTIELRLRTHDGRTRSVEAVCQNLLDDPDVRGLVWNGRDVTERKALENELNHRAHHDPLTGLPNRALLLQRLADALTSPRSRGDGCRWCARRPRRVQERQRHPRPRRGRRAAARRPRGGCSAACGTGDIAARLGGDEFAVLICSVDPDDALVIAGRIVEALHEPFTVAGHQRHRRRLRRDRARRRPPGRRTGCCATRTSRCTWRNERARAASRSSSRTCGSRPRTGRACSRSWPARSSAARSTSPSSR